MAVASVMARDSNNCTNQTACHESAKVDLRGVVTPPLRRRIRPLVFVTFCGAFEMSLPVRRTTRRGMSESIESGQ